MQSSLKIMLLLLPMFCAPHSLDAQESSVSPPATILQNQKHKHSKDDLEAIGTRKVGSMGPGNWYSIEREDEMGRKYSHLVDESTGFLHDPIVTDYVNRIAQNLVRNSDAHVPFIVKVIDSDEVNAFALPGGFLYVTSGLILAARDEAELAGVIAHEIAHVAAHHAARQKTRSQMFSAASMSLTLVTGGLGLALQEAMNVITPLSLTKFSRGFEEEADYLGVEYLYKAGYDPQALISFFERAQKFDKHKPGMMSNALATHPQTANRIKKIQKEILGILPPREMYMTSSSDFDQVQIRLTAIDNRSEPTAGGPAVLRRRPSAPTDSQNR